MSDVHPFGCILRRAALIAALVTGAEPVCAQPAPPAVLVAPAEMRDVSAAAEFVGRVKAVDKIDLRARVADMDRLTGLGLTPQDIINAVRAQNVQAAVGRIGGAPVVEAQQRTIPLTTQGRLETPEEFGAIIVRAQPNGSLIRVRDVARVELGAQSGDVFSTFNGASAAAMGIYLAPGANALATGKAVRKAMTEMAERFPDDVTWEIPYDTTAFVSASIHKVVSTLIEAFVLVSIVVFLFLGKLRATLVPIFAVPVSLVGTFAAILGARVFREHDFAVGAGAGDRDRGRPH